MIINILLTIPVILAFIFVYRKYKDDNEEFLLLKLIGYYLLGSFRFNLNNTALPAGFLVYLMFFRPQVNRRLKQAVTSLGLLVFICGLLFPGIQKIYFERQRVVNSSSNNIYSLDLKRDYDAIKEKLKINQDAKIENYNASFEDSGEIKELRYEFLIRENKGFVLYNVNFSPSKNKYTIKPVKVNEWLQYDRLINEEQFFYALSRLDLKTVKPKESYPYYTIRCDGGNSNWGIKDWDNFLITDSELRKLKDDELPVGGYGFWIFGNKKTGEASYTSDSNSAYILPVK